MGTKLAIGLVVIVILILGVVVVTTGGQKAPVAVATASPVVATATAIPTATPTPSPSPSPTAEKILADSYSAMQKVTSVKTAAIREGQPRQLQGNTVRKLGRMTATAQFQTSVGHLSDSFSSVTTSFSDGTRFSVIRIGPKLWSKSDRINASGQVTTEGTWSVSEPAVFNWPSQFFGKPLDPVLESRSFDLQADTRKLEGAESKDGTMSYRLTLSGRTNDRGQASLRGTVTTVLWISTQTLHWVSEEITTKWDDTGETYVFTTAYSDYDKDQGVKPPPGF